MWGCWLSRPTDETERQLVAVSSEASIGVQEYQLLKVLFQRAVPTMEPEQGADSSVPMILTIAQNCQIWQIKIKIWGDGIFLHSCFPPPKICSLLSIAFFPLWKYGL